MNTNGKQFFSFVLNIVKESRKITGRDNGIYESLLQKVIRDIKKLSDEDIGKIHAGERSYHQLLDKSNKSSRKSAPSNLDIEGVVKELNLCASYEEGEAILKKDRTPKLKKKDFQNILKYLNVHFTTKDTIPVLKEKIIENTIGYRIRSEAIQNYGKKTK